MRHSPEAPPAPSLLLLLSVQDRLRPGPLGSDRVQDYERACWVGVLSWQVQQRLYANTRDVAPGGSCQVPRGPHARAARTCVSRATPCPPLRAADLSGTTPL